VAQQARQHAEGRQQVGAPHNIGHRFGEQRMQSPNRGQRQSRRGFSKNQYAQRIHQRHVDFVQHEINDVVARRARAIAENCVIQQVGEVVNGRYSPVVAARWCCRTNTFRSEWTRCFRACRPDTRIFPNRRGIVEHQGRLEGIGIGNQDQAPKRQQPPPVPPPSPARCPSHVALRGALAVTLRAASAACRSSPL
jgi:hypothetical protein